MPVGAPVEGDDGVDALVPSQLARQVRAADRLHAVEVCDVTVVGVKVLLQRLREDDATGVRRVECTMTSI